MPKSQTSLLVLPSSQTPDREHKKANCNESDHLQTTNIQSSSKIDTEHDRAKITTEMIPRRPLKSESPFASRPITIRRKDIGTQRKRARYDAVLPPFISIVRSTRCPVVSVLFKVIKSRPKCAKTCVLGIFWSSLGLATFSIL